MQFLSSFFASESASPCRKAPVAPPSPPTYAAPKNSSIPTFQNSRPPLSPTTSTTPRKRSVPRGTTDTQLFSRKLLHTPCTKNGTKTALEETRTFDGTTAYCSNSTHHTVQKQNGTLNCHTICFHNTLGRERRAGKKKRVKKKKRKDMANSRHTRAPELSI